MVQHRQEASRRLFDLAEQQQGYFTTELVKAAGFAENTHPYHVQEREPIYVPRILAASATVIIRVIGSAGDGMKPYFS